MSGQFTCICERKFADFHALKGHIGRGLVKDGDFTHLWLEAVASYPTEASVRAVVSS